MATFEELIGEEMKKAMKEVIADLHLIKSELVPHATLADLYQNSNIPDEYRYVTYLGRSSQILVNYSGFSFSLSYGQTLKLPFTGGIISYTGTDLWLTTEAVYESTLSGTQKSSTSWITGQVSVGTTPASLPVQTGNQILLQANPANANNISIGSSASSTSFTLSPGQTMELELDNLALIYAVSSASGNILAWSVR